jgi:hypothetical protein
LAGRFVETQQAPLVRLFLRVRFALTVKADFEIRFCARLDGCRQIDPAFPNDGTGMSQARNRGLPANVLARLNVPLDGQRLVVSTPEACGPRNCGQSAPWLDKVSAAKMAAVMGCLGIGRWRYVTQLPHFGKAGTQQSRRRRVDKSYFHGVEATTDRHRPFNPAW